MQINGGTAVNVPAGGVVHTRTMTGAGVRTVTFDITDAQGNVSSQSFAVVVNDGAQMDQKFKALWDGMNNAVIAGDKTTALQYLSSTARAKYGPVFDALQSDYQQIVNSCSAPMRGSVSSELGEYVINRIIDGDNQVYFVYFLSGEDGVWRLESM